MPGGDNRPAAVSVLVVRNGTPLFSDVLAQALQADRRLRLLAPPVQPPAAPRACRRYRPNVVVVDATKAPSAVLSDLVRPIRAACAPAAVVLVIDEVIDDAFLVAGLEAGAAGIVDAAAGMAEVVDAVKAAAEGERLVDSTRLAIAVEAAARARESERKRVEFLELLSDREREVLTCLTRGMRNSEIARKLSISPRTVEKHVHHILDKLEVESRLAAVALATEMGGLTHPEMGGTG
ncbi:MAG TPA: response regulator transcription factor [Actinomycetota bacterium]|nr:response regulator transcription factor [Actinomycetota bacterium]